MRCCASSRWLWVATLPLFACGSSPASPPLPIAMTPAPPRALLLTFGLTQVEGSTQGADLTWIIVVTANETFPGLFVRVDLEDGANGACFASERSFPGTVAAGSTVHLSATGFSPAPRPGSTCGATFQANQATVRVFGASDPFAQTPVTGGTISVSLTVKG